MYSNIPPKFSLKEISNQELHFISTKDCFGTGDFGTLFVLTENDLLKKNIFLNILY